MVGRILIFFLFLITAFQMKAQEQILTWEIYHPIKKEWFPLGTKGSVQEALIQIGELPDPFVGKNEEKFQWVESHKWKFRSTFVVFQASLEKENFLDFGSVDTYAQIWINGKELGQTENAFRPYSFNLKDVLQKGENEVLVEFTPPVLYHQDFYQKAKPKLPAPNDVNKVAIAPYTRKPQYQFGWDWALRINTIGFWKEAKYISFAKNRVLAKNIQTKKIEGNKALVHFELDFHKLPSGTITWTSKLFDQVAFKPFLNGLHGSVEILNPKLWWPRGQGDSYLYEDVWTIQSTDGYEVSIPVKFGIRTSSLVQEKDEIGTSYEIHVNGRPVFCKGGDYIPQDIFPARVSDSSLRAMVGDMAAANYNMVRIWGGGYYPDEAFYEACDELGIMVWQDFMFACSMYPGDDAFVNNVTKELDYQIPRISSHPSVVLFNGNNEVDVAWKNWGFQAQYFIFGKDAEKIETAYKRLFQSVIPERIVLYSTLPYIHTSPLSNWGKEEYYNHGSQHYWGVWHGKDPIEDFDKKSGRFNAEYGFQSFPQMSTIAYFASEEEQNLNSEVMKIHQKSYVGNGMIDKQTKRLYGEAENFSDFVYRSQLTQAKAVGIAISSHRIQAPRCMGTLYWQVNDCWPAPTWSSIDYFGNWKALHYRAQADYRDVTVLEKTEKLGEETYFLVSDKPEMVELTLKTKLYSLAGELIDEDMHLYELSPLSAIQVGQIAYQHKFQKTNHMLVFEWTVGKEKVTRSFVHLPEEHPKATTKDFAYTIEYNEEKQEGVVILENTQFMSAVFLQSMEGYVHFRDNLRDILPGKHLFHFTAKERPNVADLRLDWL